MKCPRCTTELVVERHMDMPIACCGSCAGILLERGQAEAIDELDLGPSIEGGAKPDAAQAPKDSAHCHECNQTMITLEGPGAVEFDWCAGCERIFFDRGELSAFDAVPHG